VNRPAEWGLAAIVACIAAQEPAFEVVTVTASNGLFLAEVRKAPGQERVKDELARWRLSVYDAPREERSTALWSCFVQHRRPGLRRHLLSDDGHAFVALEEAYGESRPLVFVWRDGAALTELSTSELALDRSRLPRESPTVWLAGGENAPRILWSESPAGPEPALRLATSYGELRFVNLATGAVTGTPGSQTEPWAEPPASRAEKPGLQVPYTRKFSAPPVTYWGDVLEVSVSGDHATPNWMFVGFEVAVRGERELELVLTPVSAPPPRGSVQAQVLQRFDARARIQGLMPGKYLLRVEGCEDSAQKPIPVEVRKARALVELQRSGGFAGMDRTLRIYPTGVRVDESRRPVRDPEYRVLPRAQLQRIADVALALGPDAAPRRDSRIADGFECRLTIWNGERALELAFQDPGPTGLLRELLTLLDS
jgi:hypothetical protein